MQRNSEDIGLAPTSHLTQSHSRASSVASISRSRRSSESSRRSSVSESHQRLTSGPAYAPDGYEGYRDAAAAQRYSDRSYADAEDYHTGPHDTKDASTTQQFEVESEEHAKAAEPVPWGDAPKDSWVSKLALPLAIFVGLALAGGTSYLVHRRVQKLMSKAAVGGDIDHWKRKARFDVYDACYEGCTSCDDADFAFNACKTTAEALVSGVNCDANLMWNWRVEDRFPDECLSAVATILMGDAVEQLKQSYRGQYGFLALTIFGGLIAGFITFKLLKCVAMSPAQRRAATSSFGKSAKKLGKSEGVKRGGKVGGKKLFTVLLGLFSARGARAVTNYPCAGRDPAYFQFFQSPDTKIAGVVHGWFSECHDKQDCHKECKNKCSTTSSGTKNCKNTCKDECDKVVIVEREPRVFVERVLPMVKDCGFQLKDQPDGKQLVARIGHAGIEKNHWVRISVNAFNVTSRDRTDDMIMCLHKIGDSTRL